MAAPLSTKLNSLAQLSGPLLLVTQDRLGDQQIEQATPPPHQHDLAGGPVGAVIPAAQPAGQPAWGPAARTHAPVDIHNLTLPIHPYSYRARRHAPHPT